MHILDWVVSADFVQSLNEMLAVTSARVSQNSCRLPHDREYCAEVVLTKPCEPLLPRELSSRLRKWWIAVDRNDPNEPNWDLAVEAAFPGNRCGIVLAEAKAHVRELKREEKGKNPESNRKNHDHIGTAIDEARAGLGGDVAGVHISRDSHYQFSNRIAFAWKLALSGVPCALVYLGFIGDTGIGEQNLRDEQHWESTLLQHIAPVFPVYWTNREFQANGCPFWFLVRSLKCIRHSPPPGQRTTLDCKKPRERH